MEQIINEDAFIHHLKKQFKAPKRMVGIGDDCAVIPYKKKSSLLITTDALIEGIHFLQPEITPFELGYKLVAVNVSDIAAMGGKPLYSFMTIAFPKKCSEKWLNEMITGIQAALKRWGISLLGGDTVGTKRDLFLNLTLIGSANQVIFRKGAKKGDVLCVTGFLGDAGGGLKLIQSRSRNKRKKNRLIDAHFLPEPHLEEGHWLAKQRGVHAMMDISDGLNCDLKKLLMASNKGAVIDVDSIPISKELHSVCNKEKWDALELALTGGEDYCLLVAISQADFKKIQLNFSKRFERPLYPIGYINNEKNRSISYQRESHEIHLTLHDFSHWQK